MHPPWPQVVATGEGSQDLARYQGRRNHGVLAIRSSFRARRNTQPDIEGIETSMLGSGARSLRSQQPARHRGHRNIAENQATSMLQACRMVALLCVSRKTQPDSEGIERRKDLTPPIPTLSQHSVQRREHRNRWSHTWNSVCRPVATPSSTSRAGDGGKLKGGPNGAGCKGRLHLLVAASGRPYQREACGQSSARRQRLGGLPLAGPDVRRVGGVALAVRESRAAMGLAGPPRQPPARRP
jgi:hypothetical protein